MMNSTNKRRQKKQTKKTIKEQPNTQKKAMGKSSQIASKTTIKAIKCNQTHNQKQSRCNQHQAQGDKKPRWPKSSKGQSN